MTKISSIVLGGVLTAMVCGGAVAQAPAKQWRVEDGGNGHWYQVAQVPLSWEGANAQAQAAGGHLATITSTEENQFIASLAGQVGSSAVGAWAGGYRRTPGCESGCLWSWVTDEPWSISAWHAGEPNNQGGHEDRLEVFAYTPSEWNDLTGSELRKSLVEWDADCNNDGVVDYGQLLAGQLQDFNSNNIPDCCEQGAPCVAGSYPVQWRVQDGGNGHWYQVEVAPQGISWTAARALAIGRGGHLATPTSASENDFCWQLVNSSDSVWDGVPIGCDTCASIGGPWLGGFQDTTAPDYSEPAGGWRWVDGASWQYALWFGGGPNNGAGNEEYLQYWRRHRPAEWNDNMDLADRAKGLLIEWDADCNDDGIVDYGQCRDGSLPDYDGNNVPDCCELGTSCVVGNYPVQWRFEDGGNGHWYQLHTSARQLTWFEARDIAVSEGGYLATATSASEARLIGELATLPAAWSNGGYIGPWLGGYQDHGAVDYAEPSGGWRWVTNEPWSFTAWDPIGNQPSNGPLPGEDFLHLSSYSWTWNDLRCCDGGVIASIIEWSADCNNDGIVDKGQILRGDLRDVDGNGVPDTCEGLGEVVHVPAEYPTIQSAIDSASPLVHRIIMVAPGTYAGPIDFKGRDVVVRGAGAALTTIQGTGGQQSSVVLFSGGEPGTAALELVTVRDGATGTPAVGFPSALVGGGLYAYNSAASVRNCVFEHNAAGFGGGAYFQISTGQVSNCAFRDNTAAADGGGMLLSQGSIQVTDTVVELNQCNSRGAGMHIVEGNSRLLRASVRDNLSRNVVGGVSWSPGVAATAFLQVEASSITGNIAVVVQGGLGVLRGGLTSKVSLLNSTVCSNTPLPNVTGLWTDLGGNVICDCAGDLTLDGTVNGADLGILLAQWGTANASTVADLNGDGIVNGADLGLLLAGWGPCPN